VSTETTSTPPRLALVVLALTPFAGAYFFSYLYRAINAVVAPDLVRDLSIGAGELGLLTAAYLLAFSLFQLPLGILLDRYGPRRVQAVLVAIGAFGALLFSLGDSVLTLALARAVIGLGFAGGLMSSFKAVVIWVPEERRALANACVMSIGAIGLVAATAPAEMAVALYGWRAVMTGLAAVTLAMAAILFFVVPERPSTIKQETLGEAVSQVGRIYRDRVFWAMAPLLATTAGVQIAIQTLWAGPWLRDVAGLERGEVANGLFLMALAFMAGVLGTGAVADRLGRRGVSLLSTMLGFMLLFIVSQIGLMLQPLYGQWWLWIVFNMTGQVSILAYPWLASYFGASLSGRANTAANLLLFMAAFGAQSLYGWIIDLFPRATGGGYLPEAHQAALAVLIALQGLCLLWYVAHARRISDAERAIARR
jgi:MFS family permease